MKLCLDFVVMVMNSCSTKLVHSITVRLLGKRIKEDVFDIL